MSWMSATNTDVIVLVRRQLMETSRCADCRHRLDDRLAIERRVSGLAVFGSAYGASIGESRLCVLHDRLVSPDDRCARFSALDGSAISG